jgi:broad specificity phosphatase PhoE
MQIHLFRHGQFGPDDRKGSHTYFDPELSSLGRKQAEALGKRLRAYYPLDIVYTSDLRRAFQTATIATRSFDVELIADSRFREIYRGVCEFRPMDEIKMAYPEFYAAWARQETDFRYPNGETGVEVWSRASQAIAEIIDKGHEHVAIVTHGGLIMTVLCGYLGLDFGKRFRFCVDFCSLSTLEYNRASGRWRILRVTDSAHLEGLHE